MDSSIISESSSSLSTLITTINSIITIDPFVGTLIILISIFSFASIIILMTWAIIKIIKVNKTPVRVSSQPLFDKEKHTLNILNLVKKISEFNSERDKLSRKHERIKEITIIRDQMTIAEASLDFIESALLIKISDLIQSKNISAKDNSLVESVAYHNFKILLKHTLEEIIKIYRRVAKENHLSEKSEKEFIIYYTKKLNLIKTFTCQFLKSNYIEREAISIDEIIDIYLNSWNEYEILYTQIFEEMRTISISYNEEIEKEQKEYDEKWATFLSDIPDMLKSGVILYGDKSSG